jgi:endoglucanase
MPITSTLRRLSEIPGVSGDERAVRKSIEDAIRGHVDEMRADTLGNLLAVKRAVGGNRRRALRVMLDAHMDEVGLMIVGHSDDGGLRFRAVGSIDPRILPGKVVWVGTDRVPGVIGVVPVHLAGDNTTVQSIESLAIDIGASGKEQAHSAADVGAYASFSTSYRSLGGGKASGKAFDDRAGCSALIELLQGPRLPVEVLAAFTVQEEVGLRGARAAAYALKPDAAFALDATPANDLPMDEDRSPNTRLDGGPAVYVMTRRDISDPRLVRHVLSMGEKRGIPHQIRQPGSGGTNADAIGRSRGGVPTVSISTPCRYIHSPASVLSLADLKNTVALLRESVAGLTSQVLKR